MKHCPKCNSPMPSDELRCIRCGFDLPRRTADEMVASSDESKTTTGNPIGAELSWKTIWAQQVKDRQSREKRTLLVVYLAGLTLLAFFAITMPVALPLALLAAIVFGWFLLSLPIAYVMTLVWSIWKVVIAYKKSMSGSLFGAISRSICQLSWARVFAVVLTSNVFFIASCTGGMVLSRFTRDTAEGRTNIEQGRELDTRMSVIASIPAADNSEARKVVRIPLEGLERFKQENPNYSFVLPSGKGRLDDTSSSTHTEYSVTAAGLGKVTVETKWHDDEHHVVARYAATDRDIKPLYTKTSHDMVEFMVDLVVGGLPLAVVLVSIGYMLKWRLKRVAARNQ